MTPDQIRWLTWGAIQHRPHGAPKWNEPGTAKAIADHCGTWGLDIATQHVLAHARDPKAKTPFVIKGPMPHTEPGRTAPRPPKPSEACRHCGRHMHTPDAICDTPTLRPVPRTSDADALARLRVIHDETAAELCSHHVSRANCLECRRPTDPTPEESA